MKWSLRYLCVVLFIFEHWEYGIELVKYLSIWHGLHGFGKNLRTYTILLLRSEHAEKIGPIKYLLCCTTTDHI